MYTSPVDTKTTSAPSALRPLGKPYKSVSSKGSGGMLGMGLLIGAVLGAGVALLLAPQAGEETRNSLKRRVRRVRGNPTGVWERLGHELKQAALIKRKERQLAASKATEQDAVTR